MAHSTRRLLMLIGLFVFGTASLMAGPQDEKAARTLSTEIDGAANVSYRSGDLESARTLWLEALEAEEASAPERGRYCYNLGNSYLRDGRALEAVAWYTASLRLRPRDSDTWANLELARMEAGLEAADRGDLRATSQRLLSSLTPVESSWFAWLGLLPLALSLAFEATRGSAASKWLVAGSLCLAVLCAFPWLNHRLESKADPVLVISREAIAVRSEPRSDAVRVDELAPGSIHRRVDEIPGWIAIEVEGRSRAWMPSAASFSLNR